VAAGQMLDAEAEAVWTAAAARLQAASATENGLVRHNAAPDMSIRVKAALCHAAAGAVLPEYTVLLHARAPCLQAHATETPLGADALTPAARAFLETSLQAMLEQQIRLHDLQVFWQCLSCKSCGCQQQQEFAGCLHDELLLQRCWPGAPGSASVRIKLRVNPYNCIAGAVGGCQKGTGRLALSRFSCHTAVHKRQHGHGSANARQSGSGLQHTRSQWQQPKPCIATCSPDTDSAPFRQGCLGWRAVSRRRLQRKWSAGLQFRPPTLNRCAGKLLLVTGSFMNITRCRAACMHRSCCVIQAVLI
jgi:hypothetical protein